MHPIEIIILTVAVTVTVIGFYSVTHRRYK